MPTFMKAVEDRQIIFDVQIHTPEQPDRVETFRALMDTGAQVTAVSSRVITTLDPMLVDRGQMVLADNSPVECGIYSLEVGVPVNIGSDGQQVAVMSSGRPLRVMALPRRPNGYEVLLGMDLLSVYHITMFGGQLVLSI